MEVDYKFDKELCEKVAYYKNRNGYSFAMIDKALGLVAGRSRQVWLNGRQNGFISEDIFTIVKSKVNIKTALMV